MEPTQAELAAIVGVTQPFISQIVRREKRPSPDVASRLEAATGKHRLHWLYPDQYDEGGNQLPTPTPPAEGDQPQPGQRPEE